MFSNAIVRKPSLTFLEGLTSASFGVPIYEAALEQHDAYCEALVRSGLTLICLDPEPAFPDSTFVEDTAILTEKSAVMMRPGAPSRKGEVIGMAETLAEIYDDLYFVSSPGTIDGGDVCRLDDRFLIGISERTNREGAHQLSKHLEKVGFASTFIDIRGIKGLLHLKSGISYLGNNQVLVTDALAGEDCLKDFDTVIVPNGEEYAANCIRVNDFLLFAAGYAKLREKLKNLGYKIIELEMSEFKKMDGGLSCLSLRF